MSEQSVLVNVHDRNQQLAERLNRQLSEKNVYTINVMGAPGIGKTSVIEGLVKLLKVPCAVIEGDIESDIDTKRLSEQGVKTHQINTGGACHLDVPLIEAALSTMSPESSSVLFIENIGNLVCPAEFMIGEHAKLLICAVTDGSDKPYKYPLAFEKAKLIVLNKCDLLPYVDFDEVFFMKGVRALNPDVQVVKVSARKAEGIDEVAAWIMEGLQELMV